MNPKVDEFLGKVKQWSVELQQLRVILLDCGLKEEFKWKVPCYTYRNKNVVIIHGFKEYCALNFFKGALLKDTDNLLVQQTENSQSTRQIRFTSRKEISELEAIIKTYVFQAIEVEKAGLSVDLKKTADFDVPEELTELFEKDAAFKKAFEALTPGRQKGYLLHFSGAKQSKTRTSRIENYKARIMIGKGFHDCVCGLSKRMPTCDGSHKQLKK